MSDAEELLAKALLLPEQERAEMAAQLLRSLRSTSEGDVEGAWAAEIERRCAAVDAGLAITSDWEVVRQRIESDIFGR